ncbi:transcription elongation factor Spt5 [Candidatus Bathyarchaeota archaeon]|nr:transcription elongation factor Spt5 [Candidatus Bathyarchaeota archaeon]
MTTVPGMYKMRLADIKRTTQVFAVKTSIAHEKSVAEMVFHKLDIREPRPDVKSILVLDQLRGYIFIEAPHQRDVMIATSEIHHVKGKAIGQIQLEELDHFLKPESITETLDIGDKVEIIAGLFAGEKAYVTRIEEAKDEVTLSLVGSDNPIPIKVHVDYLKVIEKGLGTDVTPSAEGAVIGRGIKEYTFGEEESSPSEEIDMFSDDIELDETLEEEPEQPEVIEYGGHKQKVVGELFDLNVDEDDDDLDFDDDAFGLDMDMDEDIMEEPVDESIEGEPDEGEEKKEKEEDELEDFEDDDWI